MSIEFTSKKQGAELTSIKYNNEDRLHDGQIGWNRHSPVLFPMVGRLKEDKTIINGKEYFMKQHGFARDMEFEEIENSREIQKYRLVTSEETLEKYPYNFELTVAYTKTEDSVTTEYEVKNNGNEIMNFGIGGHPAYKLDFSNCYIEFEKEEKSVIFYGVENGLLSKPYKMNMRNDKYIDLNEDSFANDAIIMEGLQSNKIYVKRKLDGKRLLEFDFTGFPYLAIWSKQDAPFLCIEPWYSTADSVSATGEFKNKKGNIELLPNEKFACKYTVKFN